MITNPPADRAQNPYRIKLAKGRYLIKRGVKPGNPDSGTWYLEVCFGGRQNRYTLGTSDYSKAFDLVMRTPLGQTPEKAAPPVPKEEKPRVTIGEKAVEYEEWYSKRHKERGANKVMETVNAFVRFIGEDKFTDELTQKDIQAFVDSGEYGRGKGAEDKKRAPSTRISEFGRLRAFLRWIPRKQENAHLLDPSITRGIDLPKDDGAAREAPDQETVTAIIRAMKGHDFLEDYAILLAETGMRPEEPLAIRGVDLKGDLLTIQPWEGKWSRYKNGRWEPKSNHSRRTIRLNAQAAQVLHNRVDVMLGDRRNAPIFLSQRGRMYDVSLVARKWRQRLRDWDKLHGTNLTGWTPYDMRHAFCSLHASPGPLHMDLQDLAAYIGHSPRSLKTLMRWYVDANALRRGAPPVLTAPPGEGKITPISLG